MSARADTDDKWRATGRDELVQKPYEERKARERQIALAGTRKTDLDADGHQGTTSTGRTAETLAKKAGVGTRTVNRAIKVREHGTPELLFLHARNLLAPMRFGL